MNSIAPSHHGELVAEGKITHKGRTVAVGEVTVSGGNGVLVARGLGTWMVRRSRQAEPKKNGALGRI